MTLGTTDTPLTDAASRVRMSRVRAARRWRREAAGAVGELTPTAAAALATVERHGPLTPRELAQIERGQRPAATRTLRVPSQAGLVERTGDPSDGRSALVSITAAGRDRLRRLRGRKNAYLARRMRDLAPADLATLDRAAEILEGILEEGRPSKRERPL